MVDTINPNTSEPDAFSQTAQTPPQASNPETDSRFYGGFDRPGEVKVNLAAQTAGENSGFSDKPQQADPLPQVSQQNNLDSLGGASSNPTAQPLTSPLESQVHSSYSKDTPVNTRGILAIAGIGLVATVLICVVTFFIMSSNNTKNLDKQQATIDTLNKELSSLTESPTALILPTTDTEDTDTSTSVAPVTVDTEAIEVTGENTNKNNSDSNGPENEDSGRG